jgi:hypothetical protein
MSLVVASPVVTPPREPSPPLAPVAEPAAPPYEPAAAEAPPAPAPRKQAFRL